MRRDYNENWQHLTRRGIITKIGRENKLVVSHRFGYGACRHPGHAAMRGKIEQTEDVRQEIARYGSEWREWHIVERPVNATGSRGSGQVPVN